MADNVAIARRLYDAFNERKFDELAEAMAPDGQITVAGTGDTFQGPEGARQYNKAWVDGFPDGMATIDRIVSSGEFVVVEFTGRGTHTGPLVSSMGTIPATGRSVTLHLCDVTEFSDGKILSQHSYFDSGSLMAQLGLAAEQKATTKQ